MGFQKGHTKKGGRQKGSSNKINKTVKDSVLTVFNILQEDEGEKWNLLCWAKKNPRDFYNIAAKLIPTEVTADISVNEIIVTIGKKE